MFPGCQRPHFILSSSLYFPPAQQRGSGCATEWIMTVVWSEVHRQVFPLAYKTSYPPSHPTLQGTGAVVGWDKVKWTTSTHSLHIFPKVDLVEWKEVKVRRVSRQSSCYVANIGFSRPNVKTKPILVIVYFILVKTNLFPMHYTFSKTIFISHCTESFQNPIPMSSSSKWNHVLFFLKSFILKSFFGMLWKYVYVG